MRNAYCPICDASLEVSYEAGEPMVRYYPDGSGYPGSPPEVYIDDGCECYGLLAKKAHPESTMSTSAYEEHILEYIQEVLADGPEYDPDDYDDRWVR